MSTIIDLDLQEMSVFEVTALPNPEDEATLSESVRDWAGFKIPVAEWTERLTENIRELPNNVKYLVIFVPASKVADGY